MCDEGEDCCSPSIYNDRGQWCCEDCDVKYKLTHCSKCWVIISTTNENPREWDINTATNLGDKNYCEDCYHDLLLPYKDKYDLVMAELLAQ